MEPRTGDDPATDSLEAALAHARSQAGSTAATQATIPPSAATDLPAGVDGADVTWDETIGPGGYASAHLERGQLLRLTDIDGGTCANIQLYNAALTSERLNPADTVKVQWQAYLSAGSILLSDLGRVLATIVTDTSGAHDALCGHSTRPVNEARFGHGATHGATPNTHDLLSLAAARRDLGRRDLTSGINLFSAVRVGDDGGLSLAPANGRSTYVELRAEMDLIVLIAVGSHPLADDPHVGPVRATAWRAIHPGPDAYRASTPERERAFQNTDVFLGAL